MTEPPGADATRDVDSSPPAAAPGFTGEDDPGGAITAALTLAASRAQRAVEDLDAVLDVNGVVDDRDRERAHAAFMLAFPESYRRWRTNGPSRPPEWPLSSPAAEQPDL